MSKKGIFLILIVVLLITGFLIYWYPFQKNTAEKAISEYMEKQGIAVGNVRKKEMIKDYKQGGYIKTVELKDDPGITYEYTWSTKNGVVLIVYRDGAGIEKGMKYPPIE